MSIRAVIRNCIIYFYYNGSYIPVYFWDPGGSLLCLMIFLPLPIKKKKKSIKFYMTSPALLSIVEFNHEVRMDWCGSSMREHQNVKP